MTQYLEELELDTFDAHEFVDSLAWRTTGGIRDDGSNFDPLQLHSAFVQAISELQGLLVVQQGSCERLEKQCSDEENKLFQRISTMQQRNKDAFLTFQELDDRINSVGTKVVHLGDQLENVNTPRARAAEAQKLMHYFEEFLSPGPVLSETFTDKVHLYEAADVIQKLDLITKELPNEQFDEAKKKIDAKYKEIELSLLDEFRNAHKNGDLVKMKEIAEILTLFKDYSDCITSFIETSQWSSFRDNEDKFAAVVALCRSNYTIVNQVFPNAEQVMGKFVANLYCKELKKYVDTTLLQVRDKPGKYLSQLSELYSKTAKLSKELSQYNTGNDPAFFNKIIKVVFHDHLDEYPTIEVNFQKEKSNQVLQSYYNSKGHQKKAAQSFQELRRDIQTVIGSHANFNIAHVDSHGGETFLSMDDVAASLIQECKLALRRCKLLAKPGDAANLAAVLFDIFIQHLVVDHVDYAIEIGLQGIPLSESKQVPTIFFFEVVGQCNSIIHLVEKVYRDDLLSLVASSPRHSDCAQKKKAHLLQLETKLDLGLERSLQAIIGWVKFLLQSEQRRRVDPAMGVAPDASKCAKRVVQFMASQVEKIMEYIDGKNLQVVLAELGTRFFRIVYEHILQSQYSSFGAILLLCDMNEYRKCVREFKSAEVDVLFDTLYSLCNLLLVEEKKVKQFCSQEPLSSLDSSVISNFIQLREDYRPAKVSNYLKILSTQNKHDINANK